jgi:GAF domain-containing protein
MTTLPHDDRLALESARKRIEEMISSGTPLRETLEELMRFVEAMTPSGMIGSILILDEQGAALCTAQVRGCPTRTPRRSTGSRSAPRSAPAVQRRFMTGPSPFSTSPTIRCGRTSRTWRSQYGLRACWSTPIHGSDGKVLGTFANDYQFVRDPGPVDRELTEMITRTAAMAIEQDRHARLGVTA